MKTAIYNQGKIELINTEKPSLSGKHGAILKIFGCGLCGSDIVKYKENLVKDGTVLGHEIVGEIVEINSNTDFKVGDKIVSSHHIPCFHCTYCENENYSMCQHFKQTNICPGGFAEYVYLSEEHLQNVAHVIPEDLTNQEQFSRNIDQLKDSYDLLKLTNEIYYNASKYGEEFIYCVP